MATSTAMGTEQPQRCQVTGRLQSQAPISVDRRPGWGHAATPVPQLPREPRVPAGSSGGAIASAHHRAAVPCATTERAGALSSGAGAQVRLDPVSKRIAHAMYQCIHRPWHARSRATASDGVLPLATGERPSRARDSWRAGCERQRIASPKQCHQAQPGAPWQLLPSALRALHPSLGFASAQLPGAEQQSSSVQPRPRQRQSHHCLCAADAHARRH